MLQILYFGLPGGDPLFRFFVAALKFR